MAELLKLYAENPNPRFLEKIIRSLLQGGVIIVPTDTVYALACDVRQIKAAEKIAHIKGLSLEKSNFSFLCQDLSHISEYTRQLDNPTFKVMKKALPGPFTFILPANHKVPSRYFGPKSKKKTIGIRVPDNDICQVIIRELGGPLMSTSIHDDDEVIEYTTDPELIFERYEHQVDFVIDGGFGGNIPSTVIDCSDGEPVLLRQGKGEPELIL